MPFHQKTFDILHLTFDIFKKSLSIVNGHMSIVRKSLGFTLVEILIFLLVILSLVIVLLTSAGTLDKSRSVNLSSVAGKIASCEIERLRGLPFTDSVFFSNLGTPQAIIAPCNTDLSKLPGTVPTTKSANRTIVDYDHNGANPPLPDPDIKQITIVVTWTEAGVAQTATLVTLKSKYGI